MVELKQIYRSRQVLRLAAPLVGIWLVLSAVLPIMPNAARTPNSSPVSAALRRLFDDAVAAAALPGAVMAVLLLIAMVTGIRDIRCGNHAPGRTTWH